MTQANVQKEPSMERQKEMIADHFSRLSRAHDEGRKVVYTFVPGNLTELMLSFDCLPVLPEINALQSGMRKRSGAFIAEAERHGHSEDVCTYVKCDIGMLKKGNIGPTGEHIPPPDLLLLSYTGCFTFMKWFELLREEYDCPVAMLHVPYQGDGKITESMRNYVVKQLREEIIPKFESVTGQAFDLDRLRELLTSSARSEDDLVWALESARHRPSPIDAYFGGVYYIGPIFTSFRGTSEAEDYYRLLRDEIQGRIDRGEGPITPEGPFGEERFRLVVEGPPNWTHFREFWQMFHEEGAVVVASTYTKVGGVYDRGFRHDPEHPLETLADYCLGCYTNLNLPSRTALIESYVKEYAADGFLINSIKSCNSFSAGQLLILREIEKRTGIPGAFVETDLVDPRYFSAANVKNRLESYFQMLAPEGPGGAQRMRIAIGIDLGSTTTKAVVLDECGEVVGRGITNSRSNYDVACAVAKNEALIDTRFNLFRRQAPWGDVGEEERERLMRRLELGFRREQYLAQLDELQVACLELLREPRFEAARDVLRDILEEAFAQIRDESDELFSEQGRRRSNFFRDLAGSRLLELAEGLSRNAGVPFDSVMGIYDKSIIGVENHVPDVTFEKDILKAMDGAVAGDSPLSAEQALELRRVLESSAREALDEACVVGTGYGRARLPFPREHIRSEILCHGLGAHAMFPGTRTVLDIGGQDTKAIQVDPSGLVASFQMNDRCAAGCGRYLGYIADEMNIGVQDLGPMAMKAQIPLKINSTCTVFAGAELRDRLALGQRREDILGGLHRAMILRAMSLLARSGGIRDEFTFTGGVANNQAAVAALEALVEENYGQLTLNISADSIYTGALGGALFASREAERIVA